MSAIARAALLEYRVVCVLVGFVCVRRLYLNLVTGLSVFMDLHICVRLADNQIGDYLECQIERIMLSRAVRMAFTILPRTSCLGHTRARTQPAAAEVAPTHDAAPVSDTTRARTLARSLCVGDAA